MISFISEKKSPLLALLNSKRLEISPKNGWRARVLARRSFSEVGGGGPMISFPNWRYSLYKIRTFFEAILMRNESFRHCLAEPRQPRKKNTPCISDLAGVKFLLKKERVFFFGVLPSKYSGRWRNNADEVLAKLFFGERICQNLGSFVFEFGCRKWKRRGLVRNFPFAPLISFGEIRAGFLATLISTNPL